MYLEGRDFHLAGFVGLRLTVDKNVNMDMILWIHGNVWRAVVLLCGMRMRVFWIMVYELWLQYWTGLKIGQFND